MRLRWIRPQWLEFSQAVVYSGLPGYVLRALIARRLVRTRASPKGRLIQRESIDVALCRSVERQEPVFWRPEPKHNHYASSK
jgi:hypothetical protein